MKLRSHLPRLLALAMIASLVTALLPSQSDVRTTYADGWWNTAWKYRRTLTFRNSGNGGALTNHRVLVKLDSTNADFTKFRPNGEDIRFIDPRMLQPTPLPHQIAQWSSTGTHTERRAWIWVQVSSIEANDSTYIYMYYGNPDAADGQQIDATWSEQYRAVWLLNEKNQVFKDSAAISANGPAGAHGSPVNLGYPAVHEGVPGDQPLGFSGTGWNPGLPIGVYHAATNRTYVAFASGVPLPAPTPRAEEFPEGDQDTDMPAVPEGTNVPMSPLEPYFTYYDHSTNTWATPVRLGGTYYPPDTHFYPVIVIARRSDVDTLYVFQGGHIQSPPSTPGATPVPHHIQYFWHRLDRPITDPWSSDQIAASEHNTYPQAFVPASDPTRIYLLFRKSESWVTPFQEPEYYVMSSDGGESWTYPGRRLVDAGFVANQNATSTPAPTATPRPTATPGGPTATPTIQSNWGTIYVKAVQQEPAVPGKRPEGLSIIFGDNYDHGTFQQKQYYVFFALADDLAHGYQREHLYAIDGQDLGTYVDRTDFEGGCTVCLVFQETQPVPGYFIRTAVVTDYNGVVHVFYHKADSVLRWTKATIGLPGGWSAPTPILDFGPNKPGMPNEAQIVSGGQGGLIDLYTVSYTRVTPTPLPGGTPQPGSLLIHPRLLRLRYDGAGWQVAEAILGPSEHTGLNYFGLIENPHASGSLRGLFKEMLLVDGYPSAVNKLWAWGNTGLLKQSARAESSTPSPVGPVILFDPDQLPANTPTPPRVFAQEDNIRVAQTTPAFHNFGIEMGVEALVYLDNTVKTQYLIGKSWLSKGFSLAYSATLNHIQWYIGTGSGYASVVHPTSISPGAWYYVVGAHSAQAQTLWVNGVAQTGPAVATPVWGVNDLRLGAPSAGDGSFLDGRLGGYVALLTTAPTGAYVQASYRNFIVNDFITYGSEEIGP